MTKRIRTKEPSGFKHSVEVRFRDLDLGGHAHHSQAIIYFEEARAAYWREVVGRPGLEDIDYIMAELSVRYKQRVHYPDRLDVYVRVVRLGRKHFEMEYDAFGSNGELLVSGTSVQVMFDYAAGVSKRVPEEVVERITAQDGPF